MVQDSIIIDEEQQYFLTSKLYLSMILRILSFIILCFVFSLSTSYGNQENNLFIHLSQIDKTKITETSIQLSKSDIQLLNSWRYQLEQWTYSNPGKSLSIAAYPIIFIIWIMLYWLRPISIFYLHHHLCAFAETLPKQSGSVIIIIEYFILSRIFLYRPRVLDAWVRKDLPLAREAFLSLETAKGRKIHIPLPVYDNKDNLVELDQLDFSFGKGKCCILIYGEGGSGKTSLACLLAQRAMSNNPREWLTPHPMIPVLLEEDIEIGHEQTKDLLIETIRGKVESLIGKPEPIPIELLDRLLRYQRILIIVDGFSEMNDATRQAINPDMAGFPVKALIVTSRSGEHLRSVPKVTIKPCRVQSDRLSLFMDRYLTQQNKRDLFDDAEYFAALSCFATLAGGREVTVLLAKLYAEQMIASKEQLKETDLPQNIPDLMLNYLNNLNRIAQKDKLNDRIVHRVAKAIAWECLQKSYRPTPAKLEDVIFALKGEHNPGGLINYLELRLKLIQIVGAGRNHIRFTLDPLAEYLAGLYLLDKYGGDDKLWDKFIYKGDKVEGAPEAIKEFLLAVRDCCLTKSKDEQILELIADRLGKRVGLDLEAIKRVHLRQRINRLINILTIVPELEERIAAANTLAKIGSEAKDAIPGLIQNLQNEELPLRAAAARALEAIGREAKEAVPALTRALQDEDRDVRATAARVLRKIGPAAEDAVSGLIHALQDKERNVRASAARALRAIGPAAKDAVPALIRALQDKEIRFDALRGIEAIGGASKVDVPQLFLSLDDADHTNRPIANRVLEAFISEPENAIPILVHALQHHDHKVRRKAASFLKKIYTSKNSVPTWTIALKDEHKEVKQMALTALRGIGSGAKDAFSDMIQCLEDKDREVRLTAASSMYIIGEDAVPALIHTLKDRDSLVRVAAARSLEKIGPIAKCAILALTQSLQDENMYVRDAAIKALKAIEGENGDVIT